MKNTIPIDMQRTADAFLKLVNIMAALRHPETGCPWDLEQDFKSIAHYTIEEAYEVIDTIEKNDFRGLQDELGDLLLQVVFHSQMAHELHHFDVADVITSINEKMTTRHPHVFAQHEENISSDRQTALWEDIKAKERSTKSGSDGPASALAGVAAALPALMRAQKLQKRAARVGFDWPTAQQASLKITEELDELFEADANGTQSDITEEAGDLLFSCVNVIRKMGVDAEVALRAANTKFTKRFEAMENQAKKAEESLLEMDIEALEALWQAAKEQAR